MVLFFDSTFVARFIPWGPAVSAVLALGYLCVLLSQMSSQRRLLILLFVPMSATGEVMFSLWYGLYQYRLDTIPWYVPLGHSILLGAGLLMSELPRLTASRKLLERVLVAFHTTLVLGALVVFHDTLSTILLIGFFAMLPWMRNRLAYLTIGILVLYVELLGTYWQCWTWGAAPFGLLRTANPPVGAFACYVLAELIATKYAGIIGTMWEERRIQTVEPSSLEAAV